LAGIKFGEFGKSQAIHQTKTIQIFTYNYKLLAESIHLPNLFVKMLKTSKFTKLYTHQTFLLYGTTYFHCKILCGCHIIHDLQEIYQNFACQFFPYTH